MFSDPGLASSEAPLPLVRISEAAAEIEDDAPEESIGRALYRDPVEREPFKNVDREQRQTERNENPTEEDNYWPVPVEIKRQDPHESAEQGVEERRGSGKVAHDRRVRQVSESQPLVSAIHIFERDQDGKHREQRGATDDPKE